jgi:isoleucyl-tRNA synthetase
MAEDGRMLNNSKLELDKYDLTPEGVKQIEEVAEKIKAEGGVDAIYASPFLRARTTAGIIAKALGLKVNVDHRLKELDHGFACESRSDMPCLPENMQKNFDTKYGEGESWREVKRRMFSIMQELDKSNDGKKILLVSHGDPIWLLESAVFNMPEKEAIARRDEIYTEVGHFKKVELKNYPYNENGEVDLHRPYIDEVSLKCEKCGGKMTRLTDVFDCWFESGSMPYGQAHFPFENKKKFEDNFPADFVSEYIAQTRGWFYTMHVLSSAIFGKPPFKHVVTTGNILAENGEKLSKSKKNFPDPQLLLDKYGADSLRYFLMTSPVMAADNVFFSEKGVEEVYKNVILILSNVLRFWELYENKYSQSGETLRTRLAKPGTSRLEKIDEWILSRLEGTKASMTSLFEKYEIMEGCRAIQPLIDDLSLWYVRRNRERIREGGKSGERAFLTLGYALLEISKLIAPVMPFLADHIYKRISNRKESVHLEDWPKAKKKLIDQELQTQMIQVRELVTQGLALRKSLNIKVRQPLASVYIKGSKKMDSGLEKLILEELNVKSIVYDPTQEENIKLETALTRELIAEGYAREIMRQIQDMRKEAKYRLDEKVFAAWSSDSGEVIEALKDFEKEISKDTLLEEFGRGRQDGIAFDVEKEFNLSPNAKIWLGVRSKK